VSGYSGTPLAKKLGLKPGHHFALVDPPAEFSIPDLPEDLAGDEPYDVVLAFARTAADVDRLVDTYSTRIVPAAGLWIAWPKRASGVPTDVTEDTVRDKGLSIGLVDNKVCAVDDTWSGLRLVIRRENRPTRGKRG
jgi:hypothetical protein